MTFKNSLAATLKAITVSGKTAIFAFDVPSLDFNPTQCVRPFTINARKCAMSEEDAFVSEVRYRRLATEVLKRYPQVKLWDPFDYLCENGSCNVLRNGSFIYLDKNHVSRFGSEQLGISLAEKILSK